MKRTNDYFRLIKVDRKMEGTMNNDSWHSRVVCDFISGMTDRYALEFYGRLFSENPQTIFKPL